MSKLILRAALAGCATAGLAVAQTPTPPPIHVQPPVPSQPSPRANLPSGQTPAFPLVAVPVPMQGPMLTFRAVSPTQATMVLKTFDVAELVCPPADSPLAKPGTDPAMIAAAKAFTDVRGQEVLKVVRAHDTFHLWGMMEITTDGKTLVVNCPEPVADKIGACVEALRKLRNSHVKVDMVVFTVSSGNEAMVKLFGGKGAAAVNVDEFNKVLRELKSSGAVDILTRPSMVLLNKQTGFCQTGQMLPGTGCPTVSNTVGMTSRVTPEMSADLKSILLALEVQHTEPACGKAGGISCLESKTNVVVPDGGSMAVKVGTRAMERRIETKVPVVGDLPYMGRLFRNVGISTEPTDVVAVVTATRMADAPRQVAPPMLPEAVVPYATPLAAPVPVMLPLPIRTVGADGLERVGGNFNTLTTPPTLTPTATFAWKPAPVGVSFTRFAPVDASCVAGGMIGATVGRTAEGDTAAMMAAYKAACAAGRTDDATRLALQLLAKDPTCFGK